MSRCDTKWTHEIVAEAEGLQSYKCERNDVLWNRADQSISRYAVNQFIDGLNNLTADGDCFCDCDASNVPGVSSHSEDCMTMKFRADVDRLLQVMEGKP
jgi:hypothetical protein